ncbi:MAG: HAD family hydrolase [Clostridiales bacterium]|nr:HAD family hydrolase [Clostridiales bacterium]
MKYKHVIWDWNGTLVDDVALGHELLNHIQRKNRIEESSISEYRRIFTFPITEFYARAGLRTNKETFHEMATIFIERYVASARHLRLYPDTKKVLQTLIDNQISNSILTASLESIAIEQMQMYTIQECFTHLTGKQDFYASGKSELIRAHLLKTDCNPNEMVFVGDTLHDAEIAQKIGCDSILVNHGHQDLMYVAKGEMNIASNLKDVANIIIG